LNLISLKVSLTFLNFDLRSSWIILVFFIHLSRLHYFSAPCFSISFNLIIFIHFDWLRNTFELKMKKNCSTCVLWLFCSWSLLSLIFYCRVQYNELPIHHFASQQK
jgi:hypothetical protein